MESSESWERFWEGLTRAASCCRELGVMTNVPAWKELSAQFLLMREKGQKMYKSAPLTELQVMTIVTEIETAQKLSAGMTVH